MNKTPLILVFIVMALVIGACGFEVNVDLDQGSGNVITETRAVSNFDRVSLSGIGDVTLVQGDREELRIEAEDNVIPLIKTEVRDGTLFIDFERKVVLPTKSIKFHLTMRDIRGLETRGVSNIVAERVDTDRLHIGISGTGNIDIHNLTADQLDVNISGAGNFNAEGQVTGQEVRLSGAGNYNGEDLQSTDANITITGLGRVVVWVTDNLDITISGTGGIEYYGNPRVNQQISGLGQVKDQGNK